MANRLLLTAISAHNTASHDRILIYKSSRWEALSLVVRKHEVEQKVTGSINSELPQRVWTPFSFLAWRLKRKDCQGVYASYRSVCVCVCGLQYPGCKCYRYLSVLWQSSAIYRSTVPFITIQLWVQCPVPLLQMLLCNASGLKKTRPRNHTGASSLQTWAWDQI